MVAGHRVVSDGQGDGRARAEVLGRAGVGPALAVLATLLLATAASADPEKPRKLPLVLLNQRKYFVKTFVKRKEDLKWGLLVFPWHKVMKSESYTKTACRTQVLLLRPRKDK